MLEAVDQREEEVIGGEDRIRHICGDVGAALGGEREGVYLLSVAIELDRDEVVVSFGELCVLDSDLESVMRLHLYIINGFEPSAAARRHTHTSGARVLRAGSSRGLLLAGATSHRQEVRQRMGRCAQ